MFTGSGVALVTPFTKNNEVNYEKLAELIEFHIKNNTDALFVACTTGEGSTLSNDEKIEIVKKSVEFAKGRIPIYGGSGSNNTQQAIYLSVEFEKVGADGLLVVSPYYNKTSELGVIKHYETIANSVNIPIILYNVPQRTGMELSINAVKTLSKHKNITGIKEASGDLGYAMDIARTCLNSDFKLYSGNDNLIVPVMSAGGSGVISVVANTHPQDVHDICFEYLNGNHKKALEINLKLNGYIDALFVETSPIPIKTAMNLLGFEMGGLRLPLCEISNNGKDILIKEMQKIGLKV